MRLALVALSALFLHACCNGPFVYVDCVADALTIIPVDEDGQPTGVDRVQYRYEGSDELLDAECGTGATEGCDTWYIFRPEEALVTIEIVLEGTIVGTDQVEVVYPNSQVGACCSGVYQEQVEISIAR